MTYKFALKICKIFSLSRAFIWLRLGSNHLGSSWLKTSLVFISGLIVTPYLFANSLTTTNSLPTNSPQNYSKTHSSPIEIKLLKAEHAIRQGEYSTAHQLLIPLARKHKNRYAAKLIGDLYWQGLGRPTDQAKACQWYLQSAKNQLAQGYLQLGHCLSQSKLRSELLQSKDMKRLASTPEGRYGFLPSEAPYWFLKAASLGVSEGYCAIGKYYFSQEPNQNLTAQDKQAMALQWCARGGYTGDPEAQFTVAQLYAAQDLNRTLPQVLWWYQRSAQQGHAKAAYELAELYHGHTSLLIQHFSISVPEQHQLAQKWYEFSAQLGYAQAYAKTAMIYVRQFEGLKNSPDTKENKKEAALFKAYFWLKAATLALEQKKDPQQLDLIIKKALERRYQAIAQSVPPSWQSEVAHYLLAHFERYPLKKSYLEDDSITPSNQTSALNAPNYIN